MPNNFKEKPQTQPQIQAQAQAQTQPQHDITVGSRVDLPESQSESPVSPTPLKDLVTARLDKSQIALLESLRKRIVDENALVKFMFQEDSEFTFDISKLISVSIRMMNSEEREDVDSYLYGKDPFGLFVSKDQKEIDSLKALHPDASAYEIRDLFLRTFPRDLAQQRHSRVSLAACLLRLNGKPLGKTLSERFSNLSKLPLMTLISIQTGVDILDRAIRLELSDEESLKN